MELKVRTTAKNYGFGAAANVQKKREPYGIHRWFRVKSIWSLFQYLEGYRKYLYIIDDYTLNCGVLSVSPLISPFRAHCSSSLKMSALPFLVLEILKPTIVSEDGWRDWFTTERLPQFVLKGIALRAILYREIPFPGIPTSANSHDFLVLVQTKEANVHDHPQHRPFLKLNDLDPEESSKSEIMKDYQIEVRDYELIQDFYPEPRDSGRCFSLSEPSMYKLCSLTAYRPACTAHNY